MTLVKSKYFMLKANFPKHAKLIDDQPIIDNHEPEKEFTFGATSDKQPSSSEDGGLQEDSLQKKSMMNDPKHTLRVEDDSEEDR